MAKQDPHRNRTSRDRNARSGQPELVAIARSLAEIAAEFDLAELIVDGKDATVTVRRGSVHVAAPSPMPLATPAPLPQPGATAGASPSTKPPVDDGAHTVTSPFVGTFYRRPNPDAPTYVSIGQTVEKGAVLCIVEAMKLMNEIEADIAGTVTQILAEDGSSVEYGQPLFKIAP